MFVASSARLWFTRLVQYPFTEFVNKILICCDWITTSKVIGIWTYWVSNCISYGSGNIYLLLIFWIHLLGHSCPLWISARWQPLSLNQNSWGGSGCTHNCYGFKLNTPSIIVASMYYIKDGFYIVDCFLCVISWIESS